MRDKRGVNLEDVVGREELGGAEGGKTIMLIYSMRRESIFNKR